MADSFNSPSVPQLPSLSAALSGFGRPSKSEEKQAKVATAADSKKLVIEGTAADPRMVATAIREDNNLAHAPTGYGPSAEQLARLGAAELDQRFGRQALYDMAPVYREQGNIGRIHDASRTGGEIVGDSLKGVGAGFTDAVGGTAAMLAGLANDRAGAAVAGVTGQASDWVRGTQSERLQNQQEQAAYRAELDRQDVAAQYEQDLEDGVSFPGVRRFFREAGRAAEDLWDNPALAGDLVAEGTGSLVASAGGGGLAARAGAKALLKSRGVTGKAADNFLKTPQGKELVRRITERGMPASIGLMEAGGTYTAIQSEIQAMSEAELMEGSDTYRALREQGVSHEDARNRIANEAGLEGGAIQGLIGAASGTLVARLEADPLNLSRGNRSGSFVESLRSLGSAVLREAPEELIQETSSSAVTGYAVQRHADAGRDPLEGLGTSAVHGLTAGAGMATAMRSPEIAAVGAISAGETAARNARTELATIGRSIASAAGRRARAAEQRVDDASPVGNRSFEETAAAAQESLAQLQQSITIPETSPESTDSPEAEQAREFGARMHEALNIPAEEAMAIPDNIRRLFLGDDVLPEGAELRRMDMLSEVLREIGTGEHSKKDTAEATLWVFAQAQKYEAIRNQDPAVFGEQREQGEQTQALYSAILENPDFLTLVENARQLTAEDLGPMPEVTAENVSSPEVRQASQRTAALAQANPAGVDPRFVDQVLNQRSRIPGLSDTDVRHLRAAKALAEEAMRAEQAKASLVQSLPKATRKTRDMVSEEILEKGKNAEYKQWSLSRHQSEIATSVSRGQIGEAQIQLDNLRNFGLHMQGKLAASAQSAGLNRRSDNTVPYRTWTGTTWLEADHPNAHGIYTDPSNPNHLVTAREVAIDAQTVANQYNAILDAYADVLTGEALPPVEVPEILRSVRQTSPVRSGGNESQASETPAWSSEPAPAPREENLGDNSQVTTPVANTATSTETNEGREGRPDAEESREESQDQSQEETAGEESQGEGTRESRGEEARQESREDILETFLVEGGERNDPVLRAEVESRRAEREASAHLTEELSFPNLPKREGDESSLFDQAFNLDPEKAVLLRDTNPLKTLAANLVDTDRANEALGLTVPLRDDQVKSLGTLVEELENVIARMNQRLTERTKNLKTTKDTGSRPLTPLEAIESENKDFLGFRDARVLNLVDMDKGAYDTRLVESAAIAALHWAANAQPPSNLDREQVAKIFEVGIHEVTPVQMKAAHQGFFGKRAVEALSRNILEFWGASPKDDASDSIIRGISEGLAIELLLAMDGGIVTHGKVPILRYDSRGKPKKTDPAHTVVVGSEKFNEDLGRFRESRTVLADGLLPKGAVTTPMAYLDETAPVENSLRGQETGGEKIRKAIEAHNAVPFYRNTDFIRTMKAFGRQFYMDLLGYQNYDTEVTHRMHAESIEGKNKSLERAWDETMAHDTRVESFAAANGKAPEEVATHFEWRRGSNGRIMARGFSGQADKTMREAYVATRAVLDLSQEAHRDAFWLTVAQSADIAKPEMQDHHEAAYKAQEKILTDFYRTLEILANLPDDALLSDQEQAIIREEIEVAGLEPTAKLIHSLMAVARFQDVVATFGLDSDEARNFQHDLSLEADGKTDGPINGIINFTTGEFTAGEILNMMRGGLTLNQAGVPMNAFYAREDADDLYVSAAKLAKQFSDQLRENIMSGGTAPIARRQAQQQFDALYRFLRYFGDLEYDEKRGEIIIGRKVLKNPLTITMYGSSDLGIASKVASGATDVFYKRISDLLKARRDMGDPQIELNDLPGIEGYAELEQDLNLLFTRKIAYSRKKKGYYVTDEVDPRTKRKATMPQVEDLRDYLFSRDNMAMFEANILEMLVGPMSSSIQELMGTAAQTSDLLIASSQAQGALVQEQFRQAVEKRIKERQAEGKLHEGESLSPGDVRAIFNEVRRYGVVIQNPVDDEGYLNLTKLGRSTDGTDFSRGLQGEMSGESTVQAPEDISVAAAPMVTISRGDALMMTNYYASEHHSLKTLQVYDGLEQAADEIREVSRRINEAWTQTILENPLKDVAESYETWLRQDPLKGMKSRHTMLAILRAADRLEPPHNRRRRKDYEATFNKLQEQLGIPEKDRRSYDDTRPWKKYDAKLDEYMGTVYGTEISMIIEDFRDRLVEANLSVTARKEVLAGMTFSADHMAGGQSPYTHEGGPIIEGDLLSEMNRRYNEALDRLRKERDEKYARPAVQEPPKAFAEKVEKLGRKVRNQPVRRLSTRDVRELMNTEGVTEDQKLVFRALGRVLPDFTYLFGTPEDLTAYRDRYHPVGENADPIQNGLIDFSRGLVYIGNASPETLLHEMLHASLSRQLTSYYADETRLTENERTAILNIEKLMGEFNLMTFEADAPGLRDAARLLQHDIRRYLAEGTVEGKAAAVNEFIAWGLTNQNLIDAMRKTKVRSRLGELALKITRFLKQLLGLPEKTSLDMFSNLRLNAGSLLIDGRRWASDNRIPRTARMLNQLSRLPSDPRIEELMESFNTKIADHLRNRDVIWRDAEEASINRIADEAVNLVAGAGFSLDPQQVSAFRSVQAALASSMEMNRGALTRIQRLFAHVTRQLSVESFMVEPESDRDPWDRQQAQEKFDLVTGKYGTRNDLQGRSNLMATFLALSQVSPEFRRAIRDVELPKDAASIASGSTDERLTNAAESLMNGLATSIAGDRNSRSMLESLDRLTLALARIEEDDRSQIEKQANSILGTGDAAGRRFLSKTADRLVDFAEGVLAEQSEESRRTRETLAKGARLMAGLIDENRGKAVASALVSSGNISKSVPTTVRELLVEIIGMTDENRAVFSLVNKVRTAIQAVRQDHREALPRLFAEKFSRKLDKREWSQLHLGLGRTDIATLAGRMPLDRIRKILRDDKARETEAGKLEEKLSSLAPKAARDYLRKADELAAFMVTGRVAKNLLKNADSIAQLFGEDSRQWANPTAETVRIIDELTTLYALGKLDDATKQTVQSLAETEAEGIDFLTAYLTDLKRNERAKASFTEEARFNAWKGFIPAETRHGARLIVADDREHNKLVTTGYTRIGDYRGSGVEPGKRGYYFSRVAGNNTYHQGVMQTVNTSYFGVDPRTGYSVNGITAGRVPTNQVGVIQQRLRGRHDRGGEALIPVYDADGNVVAYERSMAPEMFAKLDRNTHLGEMIGAWAGRQVEEDLAQDYNRLLIDRLHEVWDRDRKEGREKEFVNLADPELEDPVHREAWSMVPAEARSYIREKFGDSGFMVRKDMVNNALGYREPSVGDAWIGNTRLDEKTQKVLRDASMAVLGKNAFTILTTAEKGWEAAVSAAKNTIVIKSVIVPLSNIASNFHQLLTIGVGPRAIARGFSTKLVEINQHLKNLDRSVEIRAEMARYRNDANRIRKLEAELKSLDDSSRRMSIWPLIEAGEFSTISEGLTEADAAISQGRWSDWIREQVDRLPAKFGTAGRYAAITRDTALFQGMSRAVQYGDFLAKAVAYEHHVKQEGLRPEQALAKVTEEFVNYNLLPGRVRTKAESMGLTWFWAFKLRSLKIAHRHMRDHPLRALLTTVGTPLLPDLPGVSVGTPITDNILGSWSQGKLDYSIGPGMLFSAPGLHPWVNIAY